MNKKISIPIATIIFFALLGSMAQASLPNPLGNVTNLGQLYTRIVRAFIGIIAFLAMVYFIYGGFVMLTSGGNPEKVKTAKNAMLYAVLGMVITYASWQIIRYVLEIIGAP